MSRLDNVLDVRMWSSWLNREGLCVLAAVRSCDNTVSTIISWRKLIQPVILRHLMQNYSDFYDGKLEESCARSSATERPEWESTFRRRLHQLCANITYIPVCNYESCYECWPEQFTCFSPVFQLEERFEARKHILDDIFSKRYDGFYWCTSDDLETFCWLFFSFILNFQSVWTKWSWSWEKHEAPTTAAEREWTPDRKGAFKMKRNYHSISPWL